MAFALRRPFAITSTISQVTKPSTVATPLRAAFRQETSIRAFHQQSKQQITKPSSTLKSNFQNVLQSTFRRSMQTQVPGTGFAGQGNTTQRLLYGGALFGGTLLAINLLFNRETRDDGGMPPFERAYLNQTFMHTGLGIGIIAVASRALHMNGWSYRLMAANPWLVLGVGLVGSIGTMMGTMATDPDNYMLKYGLWTGFNLTQAALLSPLMFLQPALLARAGLYTVGLMGSISLVGATAKQDKYLYLGGPLLAGVAIVALSGLAPMVVPATAARTLMVTENLWLYGGLAVFGGFTLYDVQKVLNHARMAERGLRKRDPVNEAISLELDFINIFVRMVQILGMQNRRK